MCVCVFVCARACACVCACVRACARVFRLQCLELLLPPLPLFICLSCKTNFLTTRVSCSAPPQGNASNYYSASNSQLHEVLGHTGLGIPISLCLIHAAVAQRIGLPVYMLQMPMVKPCVYQ